MAFILKSSKLLSRLFGFSSQANLVNARKELSILQWKKICGVNAIIRNDYSTAANKVLTADMLERSIHQLDLDARYKHKVLKKDIEEILGAISKWGSVTYSQTLLLLRCCGSLSLIEAPEERVKVAKKVWDVLQSLGLQFDILHYNSLLNIYIENEFRFSPEEFLQMLEEKKIRPNLITYQRLLKAYCHWGNIVGASDLLEKMKSQDLPINEDIFNSLIHGHCQVDDLESAEGILDLMKQKGIDPGSESYLHLVCTHARKGNIEEVRKILNDCEENDIVLLDKDLLEVVYSLAVNGHKEYIHEILGRMRRNFGYNTHASAVIHRLLHKNLDDIGLILYDTMVKTSKENDTRNYGKFVIDHFIRSRPANQLLELCDSLEQKGLVSIPVSYALKETLRLEDINRSLKLLCAMKERNFPIRSHYFWPLIIQASRDGGNRELLKVLEQMKNMNVARCYETIRKVVYPCYNFGQDFMSDLAILKRYGIDDRIMSMKLFLKFVSRGKFKNAELLANSKKVATDPNVFIRSLVEALAAGNLEECTFVGIIYCLLHEVHCMCLDDSSKVEKKDGSEAETEECEAETEECEAESDGELFVETPENYLEKTILALLHNCEQRTVTNVLQEMLKREIGITSEIGSKILEVIKTPNVEDLVRQLSSPNMQIKFDENLIAIKRKRIVDEHSKLRRATMVGDSEEAKKLWDKLGKNAFLTDYLNMMVLCVKENDMQKAEELFDRLRENFKPQESVNRNSEIVFGIFLNKAAVAGNLELVEKGFSFGVEFNLLNETNYYYIITAHLARNDLEKAVEVFCEKCRGINFVSGYSVLVSKLIDVENAELLQKVTNSVAEIKGENYSLILLLFQLAYKGRLKQARKLLETQGFEITKEVFRELCLRFFKLRSTLCFESLITASKGNFQIDRKYLYNLLMKLYIKENNTEKAKALCLQLEEENFFSDYEFNMLYEHLRAVGEKVPFEGRQFKLRFRGRENKREKEKGVLDENELMAAYSRLAEEKISEKEAIRLMWGLASFGRVNEVIRLAEDFGDSKSVRIACAHYLENNKPYEYLEFLGKLIKTNPKLLRDSFFVNKFLDHTQKDEKLLDLLQEVIITYCKETSDINNNLLKVWVINLHVPHRLQKAEEIFTNYIENSKTIFKFESSMLKYAKKSRDSSTIENFLSSEKLKSKLADAVPTLYSFVIRHKVVQHKLDDAVTYLKKAVEEGCGDSLDQKVLRQLSRKLQEKEESFPYPDLLNKEGAITESAGVI